MARRIRILGAGVSGLTAAITLARRGFDVEVLERARQVGNRFRGDLQGLENWTSSQDVLAMLGEMGIPITFDYDGFCECRHYDNRLREYRLRSARAGFYLIRRGPMPGSLDWSLRTAAESAGVTIRYGVELDQPAPDIIATGARTPYLVAAGINFRTNLENTALGILDSAIAPRGYAYLLAARGHGTLAVVSTAGRGKPREFLDRARKRFAEIVKFDVSDPVAFGGTGCRFAGIGAGVPRVGEAGGFQDAMWGFGIRMALQTGYLAGKAIADDRDYWKLASDTVAPVCRSTVVNRLLYNLLGNTAYRLLLRRMSRARDPVDFMNGAYRESLPKRLLFPVASLSLGRNSRP
jgi:flavin-dependent dehydrogenase